MILSYAVLIALVCYPGCQRKFEMGMKGNAFNLQNFTILVGTPCLWWHCAFSALIILPYFFMFSFQNTHLTTTETTTHSFLLKSFNIKMAMAILATFITIHQLFI